MGSTRCVRITLIVLLAVCCCASRSQGQGETATVSGLITDSSGALVPNAEVELQSVERGTVQTATTNNAGIYVFASVEPGQFQITVRKAGFKQVDLLSIIVNTQDHIEQNFRLQVGSVSESVTVNAETTNINTTDASVSTTIDRNFAENLPLNGRSFQTLILLTPGTTLVNSSDGNGGQFSVNGQRANANSFSLDGVSANLGGYLTASTATQFNGANPNFTIAGTTQGMISVDALEEFKIQSSTYAPEFGRQPGGQVSLLTRSGTNDFHGTAFDYLRNNDLDANNWFNDAQGLPKGIERQNDFGGTVGGPIVRDKTFFFFSYEGLRLLQPDSFVDIVPALCLRGTGSCQSDESPAAAAFQPILKSWPIPDGPEITVPCTASTDPTCPVSGQESTGGAPYTVSQSLPTNLDSYSLKINQRLGAKAQIFGRISDTSSSLAQLTSSRTELVEKIISRGVTLGADVYINPTTTNELRINYTVNVSTPSYNENVIGGAMPYDQTILVSAPLVSGRDSAALVLEFPDLFEVAQTSAFGKYSQRQVNIVDGFSHSAGSHQLKWGVDYRRLFPIFAQPPLEADYVVTSDSDLAAGRVSLASDEANIVAHPIYTNFSLYGQDTWRLSNRLTVTYGLRWELNPPPGERDGIQPLNVIGLDDPATAALAPLNSKLYKTKFDDFAPRLGMAYQLSRVPGKELVVRGGIGSFYDLDSETTAIGFSTFPFQNQSPQITDIPFPVAGGVLPSISATAPLIPPYPRIFAIDPNLNLPYALQWNLSIEQALGSRQSLTLSYVAAAGFSLLRSDNLFDINPNFRQVQDVRNASTSKYECLQLQFKRRLTAGIQGIASYTYGHSIDDASDAQVVYSGSLTGNDFLNPNTDKGNSSFDVRHTFSGAVMYAVPTWNANLISKALLGGWSFDAIGLVQSGLPVDLSAGYYFESTLPDAYFQLRPNIVSGQPLYLYGAQCNSVFHASGALLPTESCPGGRAFNPAAFLPVPTDANGNPTQVQGTLGRNVMRGLGMWQVDVALHRQFKITDRLNIQLRGEFFNVFNHPNFSQWDNRIGDGTFGLALSTLNNNLGGVNSLYQVGGPRSIQLALKLFF